jgi:hypothetical protein
MDGADPFLATDSPVSVDDGITTLLSVAVE